VKTSAPTDQDQNLLSRIEEALNTIRPYLDADGGDVEVVEINNGNHVVVKFTGNCAGCTMSSMTFRAGVEEAIRRLVPEVLSVSSLN